MVSLVIGWIFIALGVLGGFVKFTQHDWAMAITGGILVAGSMIAMEIQAKNK